MKFLLIVLLSVGAAVLYGIVHNQIAALVCVEYFTFVGEGTPRPVVSASPTVLALLRGVEATWWAGLGFGLPLAIASRAGRWPKLEWRDHVRGLRALLLVMAALVLVAGLWTWGADPFGLASGATCELTGPPAMRYAAVGAAHLMSHASGFLGGLTLIILTVFRRRRLAEAARVSPRGVMFPPHP